MIFLVGCWVLIIVVWKPFPFHLALAPPIHTCKYAHAGGNVSLLIGFSGGEKRKGVSVRGDVLGIHENFHSPCIRFDINVFWNFAPPCDVSLGSCAAFHPWANRTPRGWRKTRASGYEAPSLHDHRRRSLLCSCRRSPPEMWVPICVHQLAAHMCHIMEHVYGCGIDPSRKLMLKSILKLSVRIVDEPRSRPNPCRHVCLKDWARVWAHGAETGQRRSLLRPYIAQRLPS